MDIARKTEFKILSGNIGPPPQEDFDRIDRSISVAGTRGHVVIVGGGFGGLACARALAGSDWRVTVVDWHNHHLFQPLLYQVATAALSPADIAAPLRHVLRGATNIAVLMAEVTGVDAASRRVMLGDDGFLPFDVLVLATGSRYNYFAHPEWQTDAPSLKTLADARSIRRKILQAFEEAEGCGDEAERTRLTTTVIVGGGPTGVELAGTVAELARWTLKSDFRRVDPRKARTVLVEAGPRLLAAFPASLGSYAAKALSELDVEVRLGSSVDAVDEAGVRIGAERINARTIVWAAGIHASAGAQWLGMESDRQGRIFAGADLTVRGLTNVYVIGDLAHVKHGGRPLPALAQVASQQGRHLGKALRGTGPVPEFAYRSRGDTAVIGRHAAVSSTSRIALPISPSGRNGR